MASYTSDTPEPPHPQTTNARPRPPKSRPSSPSCDLYSSLHLANKTYRNAGSDDRSLLASRLLVQNPQVLADTSGYESYVVYICFSSSSLFRAYIDFHVPPLLLSPPLSETFQSSIVQMPPPPRRAPVVLFSKYPIRPPSPTPHPALHHQSQSSTTQPHPLIQYHNTPFVAIFFALLKCTSPLNLYRSRSCRV